MFAKGVDEFITGSSARSSLDELGGQRVRFPPPLPRLRWLRWVEPAFVAPAGVHFCRARRDGRGILTSVLGYFPARRTQIPTLAPRRAIFVVIPMTAVRSCSVRFGKAIVGYLLAWTGITPLAKLQA